MQKILVPTDFSEQANNAVDLASKLAQKMDAEVILLHVVEDNSVTSVHVTGEIDLPDMQDRLFVLKLIEKAKTNLADAVAKYSDVNIKKEIRIGNAYHNIKDIITGHDVDLVVMGTKGTNTLTEVLMGSNAEKVVRHAACPVLTLKLGAEDAEFKNIVFATGLNDQDNSCTQVVRDFQTIFNAKIHVSSSVRTKLNYARNT